MKNNPELVGELSSLLAAAAFGRAGLDEKLLQGPISDPSIRGCMEKTRLAAAATPAEVIGACAVLISLIYVGIQVNQSVQATRLGSVNNRTGPVAPCVLTGRPRRWKT